VLSVKTKEHIRRWAARKLPKCGALLGGLLALGGLIAFTGGLLRVVTVTDSQDVSVRLITAAQDADTLLEQAGIPPLEEGDVIVEENETSWHILRAFTVPITADGATIELLTTGGTVLEILTQAGITPGPDDIVTPAVTEVIAEEGTAVTLQRVEYREYTVSETITMVKDEVSTSLFYRRQDYTQTIREGCDGLDMVTYQEKWVDGQLAETVEIGRETQIDMVSEITKVYGEQVPVSNFVGPEIVDGKPVSGVVRKYTGQRATGYSASPTAKGASGRHLTYGTAAVNPNEIPYGSLMYITSDDGRFVYGYAYAADTGIAMMSGHAFIDLYYETYAESVKNAVIPVTIYVLDEETAAQYREINDAILEADTMAGTQPTAEELQRPAT